VENGNLVNLPTFIPLMMDLLYVPSFFGILADNAKHAIPQKFTLDFMQELSMHMQSIDKIRNLWKSLSYKLTAFAKNMN
ncbi:MAG TPA: hypothetical protein VFY68_03640, partial [Nitrososphaeraceae archaeon]|nr:hypothetical protein [Nitrososphaeraceae archaeon]